MAEAAKLISELVSYFKGKEEVSAKLGGAI